MGKERNDSEGNLRRGWRTLKGDCRRTESSRLGGRGEYVWILAVILPYLGDRSQDLTPLTLTVHLCQRGWWYQNLLCRWNEATHVQAPTCPRAREGGAIFLLPLPPPHPKSIVCVDLSAVGMWPGMWPRGGSPHLALSFRGLWDLVSKI